MKANDRPVYLSLTQFGWPVTAIASILHRITGVLMFVGTAYLIWLLDLALRSQAGFASAVSTLAEPLPKLVLWGVLVLFAYHIVAGVKHMFMDFHVGDSFEAASRGAYIVFIVTAVLAVLAGAWLW